MLYVSGGTVLTFGIETCQHQLNALCTCRGWQSACSDSLQQYCNTPMFPAHWVLVFLHKWNSVEGKMGSQRCFLQHHLWKKMPHYNVRLYYFLKGLPECVFVCERRCILSGWTRTALSGKSEELWWFFFLPAVFKACALSCHPLLAFSWLYNKHVGVSRSRNISELSFNHPKCHSLSHQRHYIN